MINPSIHFRLAVMTLFLICVTSNGQAPPTATAQGSLPIACREITIYGAVRTPARFDVSSNVSVAKALAMAGGPNEHAGKTLHVLSPCNCSNCSEAASRIIEYDLAGVLGAKENGGPSLTPGDIVVVDEVRVVYITGNVARKQEVKFTEDLTVSKAIAFAGGVAMSSDLVVIRIIRRWNMFVKPILVDLKAVRESRADDIKLEPWDIVDVSDAQGHFQSRPSSPHFGDPPINSPHFGDPPIKSRKDNSA
jgi:SLBB domain